MLTDNVFLFCKSVVRTACKSQAYFIMLSPRLSVTDTICPHFHFSVSRPGLGGIQSPISFLFICGCAKCLSCEQGAGLSARVNTLCSRRSLPKYLEW